jgi:hypothetical protein
MKTIQIDTKLDVGDTCYIISKNEIVKCQVQEVWVNYKKEFGEHIIIEYNLISSKGIGVIRPEGVWNEKYVFATKEELLKYIEELK